MTRCCSISLTFAAFIVLTSCSTELHIVGPRATTLLKPDAEQIKQLILQRPDLRKPVLFIYPMAPNRVSVQSGRDDYDGADFHKFIVVKRSGKWSIDESSISSPHTIIVN